LAQDINTSISGSNVVATVPFGYDISDLKAIFSVSPKAELLIDQVKQVNSKTASLDYTINRIVSVVSENKLSQTNYMVALTVAKNNKADFINYSVTNQIGTTIVNAVDHTLKLFVNNNATLASLKPIFQVSELATVSLASIVQSSGVTALNYTSPFVYNVTAQNGDIVNWTVTIERAKPTITLLGAAVVSINKGCSYSEAGYVAKDNLDADITSGVLVSGTVDVNTTGQYTLTYTAKDALNNTSSVTRIINVSAVPCTLGLDVNKIDSIVVYPNPVKNGKVYILTPTNGIKNIKISDLLGKKVFSLKTADKEINLHNLPKDVYIIEIEEDGKALTQKLIIE
jgi:hypothetical protein